MVSDMELIFVGYIFVGGHGNIKHRRVARRTHGSTCFHIIFFFFIYLTDVLECFSYLVVKNAKFSWLASLANLSLLIFSKLGYL